MTKDQHNIRRKLRVLNHVQQTGNVSKTSGYFPARRQKGESLEILSIGGKGPWPNIEKRTS